jgi:hypothetical protein
MVVEAMAEKEDGGESAARSALEKILELCRGAKNKSVGMIGRNLLSPDFVPSLPKPTFKSVLMLPRRGMSAQEYQPVNRSRARDASEAKAGDEGEKEKKNGENPISLANAKSEKVYDEENLEKVNDARQKSDRNDVEKNGSPDRILCGPESFARKESESEKDLAGDVGESVEGWGTWAKPGSGSELQGEEGKAKIKRNKRLNKATEPRGNPSPMTPNDLPPCTFKEDIARMSDAFKLNARDSVFEATTECLGLGEGEEFILIKVSKGKRKCWATFLSDDPELPYVDMFPIGTSVEKMLGDRDSEKNRRDEVEKQRRAGEFFNRWASEPGERDNTGLRRAFKSRPGSPKPGSPKSRPGSPRRGSPSPEPKFRPGSLRRGSPSPEPRSPKWGRASSKPPAEPKEENKESDWETVRAKDRASRTIATWGGGAYHWSREFRDEIKAEDESWGAKRIASERSAREALMAEGASPPRRASSANTSFMDEIDDPHGDYGRMGNSESSSYSLRGYTERDMARIKDLIGEDHASEGDCISIDGSEKTCTEMKSSVKKGRSNKRKKGTKKGAKKETPQTKGAHPSLKEMDKDVLKEMAEKMIPKFAVNDKVRFEGELNKYDVTWIYGIVREIIPPGDPRNPLENLKMMYLMVQMDEDGTIMEAFAEEDSITDEEVRIPRSKKGKTVLTISLLNALHDLERVGIDTCSAVAVSTEPEDFLFIDDSPEAKESVSLRGVGGENTAIGGRGPMVVKTLDKHGNEVLMFDPSGVYLNQEDLDDSQARFRIFGQARLRRQGLRIVQDKDGDDLDNLIYKGGEMEIPLEVVEDIITVKTLPVSLTQEQREGLTQHMDKIIRGMVVGPAVIDQVQCASLILNEANLTKEERARLIHWRQAHRQSGEGKIHENCPICEGGKRKTKGFKRNEDYRRMETKKFSPYHRIYVDGYGGQNSMGEESYQEAKGGFVFVCPSSGAIKVKLYASSEQFPAIPSPARDRSGRLCVQGNVRRHV